MATSVFFRSALTKSITPASVVPPRNARSLARWIVGPSATGSLNGTPSSITSAPASAAASTIFSVAASDGSPAVIYATNPISPERASCSKRLPMRVCAVVFAFAASSDISRQDLHIFVSAPGNIQNHKLVALHLRSTVHQLRQCVRRFQGGDNSLDSCESLRGFDCVLVSYRCVLCTPAVREPCVFRPDRRVIESRRNRMRCRNLPVERLQQVCVGPLEHAGLRS